MKKRKGFTLVELLATIIIIAILVGVGTFIYVNFIGEGKKVVVKITKESLAQAAVLYVKEFKTSEKYWTPDIDIENNMYACTTVRRLKDIGNLPENIVDAETGDEISDITTIKVIRDANKVVYAEVELNSKECDMEPPKFNITITGNQVGEWYTGIVNYKIEPDAGMWGTSTYNYYFRDENNNIISIKSGENAEVYEGTIPNTESFKKRQICAIGSNINDIPSEEYCEELKLDNITPGMPTLIASDGIASGEWHKDNFNIKVSGGEGPLSGIYYKYGTKTGKLENKLSNNTISNISEHGKIYYVETYSNVGKTSGEAKYEVKIDKEKPTVKINVTGSTKSYNNKTWYYNKSNAKATITSTVGISGVSKYEYYITNSKGTKKVIASGTGKKDYSSLLNNIINGSSDYGENVKICGTVTSNAGITSDLTCKTINVDFTTPSAPTLVASDRKASGTWHNANFNIKVSGGGSSPSGIYYKYGTSTSSINTKVSNNAIAISTSSSKTYSVITCNNLGVCSSASSYVAKLDKDKPTVKVNMAGSTKSYNSKTWYYNKSNAKATITSTVGISGVSKYEYYITNSKGTKKVIASGTGKKDYSSLLNNIINGSSDYGENVKICGTVTSNAGITSDLTCKTINVDFTTPSAPTLVASDRKASGTWHNANFNIKVSGGGSSPSGIYYKYGTSTSSINTKVSNNAIAISTSSNNTYSVITCNNLGVCSSASSYVAKLDKDKPQITSFSKSTSNYTVTLTLTATFKDSLSGVSKYKISKDSSYTSSGWTTVSNTTSSVTKSYTVSSNGTYYVWVQDAVGNYSYSSVYVSNIASVTTVKDTFYSTAGSTITDKIYASNPLQVKNVTVNTGRVTNYYISGNYIYVTVTGGRTYTDSEKVEVSTKADYYYADEIMEEECDCYDGGRLSRGWCTDSDYQITGKNWYVCESYGEWNFDDNTETKCDRGYSKGDYWCDTDPQGDSCSNVGSTKTIKCYAMCEFDDYRPDCYDVGTGDYECDSRYDYLIGSKCYYCDEGDFDRSDRRCYDYEWVDYDYWEYNVTVEYYR